MTQCYLSDKKSCLGLRPSPSHRGSRSARGNARCAHSDAEGLQLHRGCRPRIQDGGGGRQESPQWQTLRFRRYYKFRTEPGTACVLGTLPMRNLDAFPALPLLATRPQSLAFHPARRLLSQSNLSPMTQNIGSPTPGTNKASKKYSTNKENVPIRIVERLRIIPVKSLRISIL